MPSYFDTDVFKTWLTDAKPKYAETKLNLRHLVAELIGMTFFVYVGTGTAVSFSSKTPSSYAAQNTVGDSNVTIPFDQQAATIIDNVAASVTSTLIITSSFGIITALAFGMAIMCLVYALGHISGGHFNPAVTLSLVLSGNCNFIQGSFNIVAQIVGAILASAFVMGTQPGGRSTGLGANSLSDGVTVGNAFLGEAVMTSALCFVVHMTCCDSSNNLKPMAPLAIGFTVFLAHAVMIPIDGCSINPARSLGPAIVSGKWSNGQFWVFVVGPFVGSVFGFLCWLLVSKPWDQNDVSVAEAKRAADADVQYIDNKAASHSA